MLILNNINDTKKVIKEWKKNYSIALVPTMGALHEGHLKLVEKAKSISNKCIVSIFVNPIQFGPAEDFKLYPRTLDDDKKKLLNLDVDALFLPNENEMYSPFFQTTVLVKELSRYLCGKSRPGHFEGVSTVCIKLFNICEADYAVFGQKDFQQLKVIEQMVKDLNIPISIVPHPIVREKDGLAMSSRNRYLTVEERLLARVFPQTLENAVKLCSKNSYVGEIRNYIIRNLNENQITIDYIELCSEEDLVPIGDEQLVFNVRNARLFGAIKIGRTRLIDNMKIWSLE